MTHYDTTWLRALQNQRKAEAPTEMTRYPYYFISDWKEWEIDWDEFEDDCDGEHPKGEHVIHTDLMFLTRAEADTYIRRHGERLHNKKEAYSVGEAAYRAESMVRLLHLVDNIDLDKSTIVLKDDAAPVLGGF